MSEISTQILDLIKREEEPLFVGEIAYFLQIEKAVIKESLNEMQNSGEVFCKMIPKNPKACDTKFGVISGN